MTECHRVPKKVVLLPRGDALKVEHEDLEEEHSRRFDDFEVKGVSIDGRAAVRLDLRLSKEASKEEALLKHERSLLLLAEKERIHPVIHALSVLKAPFGCEGFRLASLEDHKVPLNVFLEEGTEDRPAPSFVDYFFGCLLRLDELGLCLCDISPESFSMDPATGHCFVSSWNPAMCVWMDKGLMKFFEDREKQEKQEKRSAADAAFARLKKRGTVCARVRGTQLYFMMLLLHMHMQEHADTYWGGVLLERLRNFLRNSCVPLQALVSTGKELCKQGQQENSVEAGGVFVLIAIACAKLLLPMLQDDEDLQKLSEGDLTGLLEWFLVTYPKKHRLLEPSCSGKDSYVELDHASYEDDEKTLGGSKRGVFLAKYLGRRYPCPVSSFARRYELDEQQLFSLRDGRRQQIHVPSMRVGY